MIKRTKTLTAWLLALMLLMSSLPLGVLGETIREFSGSLRLVDSMVPVDNIATVQIYNEDGSSVVSTQYLVKGEDTIIRPATPEKDNGKFEGWYTSLNGAGTPWNFDTIVTGDVNLYPFFKELRYVFFQDDTGYVSGGDGRVILTKQGVEGEEYTTSEVSFPMSSLLSIEGWYTEKNPNHNQTPKLGDKITTGNFRDVPQGGLTLYPRIVTGNYLSFDTGVGASYVAPQFVPGDENPIEPSEEDNPTRPGYTFLGWVTAPDGETSFPFGQPISGPTTAYAKWQATTTTYTVVFWKQSVHDDKNAAEADKTYDFAEATTREAASGTSVAPTDADGDRNYPGFHYNAGKSVEVTVAGDGTTVLNVYYDRNLLTIDFHRNGQWGAEDGEYTGLYGQTLDQNGYTWPSRPTGGHQGPQTTNTCPSWMPSFLMTCWIMALRPISICTRVQPRQAPPSRTTSKN